jgi:hypothetical protein
VLILPAEQAQVPPQVIRVGRLHDLAPRAGPEVFVLRQVAGGLHEDQQVKVRGASLLRLQLPHAWALAEFPLEPRPQRVRVPLGVLGRREAFRVGAGDEDRQARRDLPPVNAVQVPQQPQTARSSELCDGLADAGGAWSASPARDANLKE